MNKIKILLVDDNEMIRIYFRDVFWIHGLEEKYELTTVENIDKAEKMVYDPETRPSLIFLDLGVGREKDKKSLPEQSFEFLKKIKGDPKLKNIKIVIFTGHTEKIFQDKAKELGADGYIKKEESMPNDLIEFLGKLFAPAH